MVVSRASVCRTGSGLIGALAQHGCVGFWTLNSVEGQLCHNLCAVLCNVVFRPAAVVLRDFAQARDTIGGSLRLLKTLSYVCPEVIQVKSSIYSGVILVKGHVGPEVILVKSRWWLSTHGSGTACASRHPRCFLCFYFPLGK